MPITKTCHAICANTPGNLGRLSNQSPPPCDLRQSSLTLLPSPDLRNGRGQVGRYIPKSRQSFARNRALGARSVEVATSIDDAVEVATSANLGMVELGLESE